MSPKPKTKKTLKKLAFFAGVKRTIWRNYLIMCTNFMTLVVLNVIMWTEWKTWKDISNSFTTNGMTCIASNVQFGDVSKGSNLCKIIGDIVLKHITRWCITPKQPQKGKKFDKNLQKDKCIFLKFVSCFFSTNKINHFANVPRNMRLFQGFSPTLRWVRCRFRNHFHILNHLSHSLRLHSSDDSNIQLWLVSCESWKSKNFKKFKNFETLRNI